METPVTIREAMQQAKVGNNCMSCEGYADKKCPGVLLAEKLVAIRENGGDRAMAQIMWRASEYTLSSEQVADRIGNFSHRVDTCTGWQKGGREFTPGHYIGGTPNGLATNLVDVITEAAAIAAGLSYSTVVVPTVLRLAREEREDVCEIDSRDNDHPRAVASV